METSGLCGDSMSPVPSLNGFIFRMYRRQNYRIHGNKVAHLHHFLCIFSTHSYRTCVVNKCTHCFDSTHRRRITVDESNISVNYCVEPWPFHALQLLCVEVDCVASCERICKLLVEHECKIPQYTSHDRV